MPPLFPVLLRTSFTVFSIPVTFPAFTSDHKQLEGWLSQPLLLLEVLCPSFHCQGKAQAPHVEDRTSLAKELLDTPHWAMRPEASLVEQSSLPELLTQKPLK